MYQLCVLVVFGMTLWLSARLSSGKMVCSDAEQLVELAHVDVSVLFGVSVVLGLAHAYVVRYSVSRLFRLAVRHAASVAAVV